MPEQGQRLLRLQRRRGRHPLAARRRAPSGWRTSTSTCTTATASRRCSTTTRGCSRSACTRPARCSSRAPASPRTPAGRAPRAARSTWRCRRAPSDAGWLRAFHAVVPPLVREFAPDVLVTQHGCDSHIEDPLAHLMLTVDGQRAAYLALHDLAHEVCDGQVGGHRGRRLRDRRRRAAVPGRTCSRSSAATRSTRRPRRPRAGGRTCSTLLGRTGPFRMTDGRTPAYRDWSAGLRPLGAGWTGPSTPPARRSFPLNGLDPCPEESERGPVGKPSADASTRHAGAKAKSRTFAPSSPIVTLGSTLTEAHTKGLRWGSRRAHVRESAVHHGLDQVPPELRGTSPR